MTRPGLHLRNSPATFLSVFLLVAVSPAWGLLCYQCGHFTEGAGSITPCINLTEQHLKNCPPLLDKNCVKYLNGGSVVRDCADVCTEKESDSWGTSIYCCSEDACNAATSPRLRILAGGLLPSVVFFTRLRFSAFAFLQVFLLFLCLFY